MATNKPIGDNARVGAVKGRSQVFNPVTGLWTIHLLKGLEKKSNRSVFRNGEGNFAIFINRKEHTKIE